MRRKDKKVWIRDMAAQRMVRLFDLADESFGDDPDLSRRYVFLARRIGMRHRVRMPFHLKRRICKGCGAYLVPGASCRVRVKDARVVTTCLECGYHRRIPFYKAGR
ncbi:MAG: ribonuclease P [ANME-2 cluster archaeon]|nr:ribonuclease P [ANME-2 cluster archaeon]